MPKKADNSMEAVGSSYLLWTCENTTLTRLTFAPESPEWFTWLTTIPSFRFKSKRGKYTARKEQREQGGDYWIATIVRLEEVAEELTKHCENASSLEFPQEPPTSAQL